MQQPSPLANLLWRALMAGALLMPAAVAAEADLAERIAACRQIANDADRLACYDSVARAAGSAREDERRPSRASDSPQAKPETTAEPAEQAAQPAAAQPSDASRQTGAREDTTETAPREMLVAAFGAEGLDPDERPPMPDEKLDELRAKVVESRKDPYGKAIVTLDNGQVWHQTQPKQIRFREGDEVIIERRGFLEGYLLKQPRSNRRIDVERVK